MSQLSDASLVENLRSYPLVGWIFIRITLQRSLILPSEGLISTCILQLIATSSVYSHGERVDFQASLNCGGEFERSI